MPQDMHFSNFNLHVINNCLKAFLLHCHDFCLQNSNFLEQTSIWHYMEYCYITVINIYEVSAGKIVQNTTC